MICDIYGHIYQPFTITHENGYLESALICVECDMLKSEEEVMEMDLLTLLTSRKKKQKKIGGWQ